jgi:Ca2+-binding RTX toxin-like protein
MAIFNGGNGNDLLTGTDNDDTINGRGGNDTLFGEKGNDSLQGNRGADLIFGGDGNDTLIGEHDNDTLVGDKGSDRMIGGTGDDILGWNDGDGSDVMRGNAGEDVTAVNGSVLQGDNFELRGNGRIAEFERLNLVGFTLNVDDVEKFDINGLGGNDTLTVLDLSRTDVETVIFNGGKGNDSLDAKLGNVAIVADGGDDRDFLSGSDVREITDTLDGGRGNDTIVGNKGNDIMIGDQGNDRLIWNDGDGSDVMEGDSGSDITEVNGSVLQGDNFELRANGDRAAFERLNLVNFLLDVDNVERFEINGIGGDDTLTVQDLTGTDVQQVFFKGGEGNDLFDGSESSTQLNAKGEAGNDTLIGGSANDTLDGGSGNDDVEGEKGDDRMIGGSGNDTLGWDDGDGSDRISGNSGVDIVEVEGSLLQGDDFVLGQSGTLAIFDRVNLGLFTLTVDTSEQFEVSGKGGNDKFTVKDLSNTAVKQVTFEGGAGRDLLDASLTDVKIIADGGAGNDTLIGGNNNNTFTGGAGRDTFLLQPDSINWINDFNNIEGDKIQLSQVEFGISSTNQLDYDGATGELSFQDNLIATIQDNGIAADSPFNPVQDVQLV